MGVLGVAGSAASIEPPNAAQGPLFISEVMVDPLGNEPRDEWIELWNGGHVVSDEESLASSIAGNEGAFAFPAGMVIAAQSTLVVANSADSFWAAMGSACDAELRATDASVPDLSVDGRGTSQLNLANGGDELLLVGPSGDVVDAVSWGSGNVDGHAHIGPCDAGETFQRQFTVDVDPTSQQDQLQTVTSTSLRTGVPTPHTADVLTSTNSIGEGEGEGEVPVDGGEGEGEGERGVDTGEGEGEGEDSGDGGTSSGLSNVGRAAPPTAQSCAHAEAAPLSWMAAALVAARLFVRRRRR
jgi:MYXO-CTERM domain-containing protein